MVIQGRTALFRVRGTLLREFLVPVFLEESVLLSPISVLKKHTANVGMAMQEPPVKFNAPLLMVTYAPATGFAMQRLERVNAFPCSPVLPVQFLVRAILTMECATTRRASIICRPTHATPASVRKILQVLVAHAAKDSRVPHAQVLVFTEIPAP